MKHNSSMLFLLRMCFLIHICIILTSCMNQFKICGKYKNRLQGALTVSCFEQIVNKSNSACGHLPDFEELKGNDTSSPKLIELQDCSLKPGIFGSLKVNTLEFFLSSQNTITVLQNNSFHGMCSLQRIYLRNDSIEVLEPSAFSCLSRLTKLNLDLNKIALLPIDVFKELRNVRILTLRHNRIHNIPDGIFDNLIYLYALNIKINYLKSVPDNLFDHMRYLKFLSLSDNQIETLDERILSNLTQLTKINLYNNQFKTLRNVFSKNAKLHTLTLDQNEGLILNDDTLNGLYSLTQIRIDHCNIVSLPNGLFKDTQYLTHINMSRNSLVELNSDYFDLLKHLEFLNVSSNSISDLRDQPFKHNENLTRLDMSNNKLSEIKSDSFQGLTMITILDISFNYISKIDENAFKNMSKLIILKLNDNLLTVLHGPYPFGRSKGLYQVDVSNNRLTDISNINWQQLPVLRNFNATNNTIYDLFVTNFTTNQSLNIHLEFNKVKYIHLNTVTKGKVSSIGTENYFYMEGNPLECDCDAYNLYVYLRSTPRAKTTFPGGLFCQNPEEYKNMSIMTLNPTYFICNITELCPQNCSCSYVISDNVQIVNCSSGGHANIPIQVPYDTNILDISHNNISSLARLNDKIWENLTDIHADYNEITSDVFSLPMNIKLFNLHHNKLKKFPEAIKLQFSTKKDFKITLSNNLWPCDCSIIFFNTYVNHIVDVRNVHCIFSNKSFSYTSVMGLKEGDVCPVVQYIQHVIISTVLFSLISILVFYYRHKLYVLSFMYSHCNSVYMLFRRKKEIERNLYDCFISYSSSDREVTLAILEELEKKPPYYKFCIHERNWMPGQYITNNILHSVTNSRKTLIIVSKTFLQSSYFYLEFQAAYKKTLEDKTDRLIIVLKGELPDEKELDSDVLYVISSKTYLQWGERWFWEKLRYAIYSENYIQEQNTTFCLRRISSLFGKQNQIEPARA